MRLNMESLFTVHVENQHALTYFKGDTFTAIMFSTLVEEEVTYIFLNISGQQRTRRIRMHITNCQHQHMHFPFLASKFQSQPYIR